MKIRRKSMVTVITAAVASIALLGGTYATMVASAGAPPQSIQAGTMTLSIQRPTGAAVFSDPIGNLAAGDSVYRYLDLANTGTLPISGLTLGQTNTNSLLASSLEGLDVSLDSCSSPWTVATGVCAGTTDVVMAAQGLKAFTAPVNLTLSGARTALDAGSRLHLRLRSHLADAAPNALQTKTETVTYTFRGGQASTVVAIPANLGVVSTFAGSGVAGFADSTGAAVTSNLGNPRDIAIDLAGTTYVADVTTDRILKVTPDGVTTTLAGSGVSGFADGPGAAAQFDDPTSVALDSAGTVYVADTYNNRIRKINSAGLVSTLAWNGAPVSAQLNYPQGIAVDNAGTVYVADTDNHRIRRITPEGVVSTLAGTGVSGLTEGPGVTAQFNFPSGVVVDTAGMVYVADRGSNRIRKITSEGVVSTLAGAAAGSSGYADGVGDIARFTGPRDIAVDIAGTLYVTDADNYRIRKITSAGVVSTLAGTSASGYLDGVGDTAQFAWPAGVAVGPTGTIYVADVADGRIRTVTPDEGVVSTTFAIPPAFNSPSGVVLDSAGTMYVADYYNNRIRKVTPAGVVSTFAGSGVAGYAGGPGATAQFKNPQGIAVDSADNIYVADTNNHSIRKITPAGVVSTLAGTGYSGFVDSATVPAQFASPASVAVDAAGMVYVADTSNHRIRKITPAGVVSTLAGTGVSGFVDSATGAARFFRPEGIAVDAAGTVYVTDTSNHSIRKVTSDGITTTLAGTNAYGFVDNVTGAAARFARPAGIAVGPTGMLYVADTSNERIRQINPANNNHVSTLAGSGVDGFADGPGATAQFLKPRGIAVDAAGKVYVADRYNERIRKIS